MCAVTGWHSGNGKAPQSRSWQHLHIDRRSRSYCRVTFDHPPVNRMTATTIAELTELVGLIEQDPDLTVVVFDSANADHYLASDDPEPGPDRAAAPPDAPAGMPAWTDVLMRLTRAPVVSIASIRGRAGGAGSEFVLACDLRFASREHTRLGLFGPGIGVTPGGGPMAALCRLIGRARTLEISLVGDDLDGPCAEQYGVVNRLIADGDLDAEVDEVALRLERLDQQAIARTKSAVDLEVQTGVSSDADFGSAPASPRRE